MDPVAWLVGTDPVFHAFFLRLLLIEAALAGVLAAFIGPRLTTRLINREAPRTYKQHFRPLLKEDLAGELEGVKRSTALAIGNVHKVTEDQLAAFQGVMLQGVDARLAATREALLPQINAAVAEHLNGFLRQLQAQAAQEQAQLETLAASDHGRELAARSAEARRSKKVDRAAAEASFVAQLADRGYTQYVPIIRHLLGDSWGQVLDLYVAGDQAGLTRILTPVLQLAQKQAGSTMSVPATAPPAEGKGFWE